MSLQGAETSQFSIMGDCSDPNGLFSIILLLNNGQTGSHTFFTIIMATFMRNPVCVSCSIQVIIRVDSLLNKSRRHHGVRYFFHFIYIGLRSIRQYTQVSLAHIQLSCLLFLLSPRRVPCLRLLSKISTGKM